MTVDVSQLQQNFEDANDQLNIANEQFQESTSAVKQIDTGIGTALDNGNTEAAFILVFVLMYAMLETEGAQMNVQGAEYNDVSAISGLVSGIQTETNDLTTAAGTMAGDPDGGNNGQETEAVVNDSNTLIELLQDTYNDLQQCQSWMDPTAYSTLMDSLSSITNTLSAGETTNPNDLTLSTFTWTSDNDTSFTASFSQTADTFYGYFGDSSTPSAQQTSVTQNLDTMQTTVNSVSQEMQANIQYEASQYSTFISMIEQMQNDLTTLFNYQIQQTGT